jgi:hypothetical protein
MFASRTTSAPLGRLAGPALILAAAAVATLPQMLGGVSCGHDYDFHLVSWIDCLDAWRHGLLYPHWASSANFNAGEPRFVFYPPLTWMAGAALGAVLPWTAASIALTWLLFAASGLATRALARTVLSEPFASLAGCIALCSGYSIFNAYERGAVAEMAGGFLLPLLLLYALRDRRSEGRLLVRALDGSAAPLTLVVAACWLSNAPLGVMASYLLAAFALALALTRRSWAPVLRAAVAAALGLALAGLYLVPAALEQKWIDVRQAVDDPGLAIQNSWLFARHLANPNLQLHDQELARVSAIAVVMIALALIGLAVAALRRKLPERSLWLPLALIPAVALLLQLPFSAPVWNLLPRLRYLQFPWRWLLAVQAPMGIFLALALQSLLPHPGWLRRGALAASLVALAVFALFTGRLYFQPCDEDDSVAGMMAVYSTGEAFPGVDEYAPPGADNLELATNLPGACLTNSPTALLGQHSEFPDTNPDWDADQGSCLSTAEWRGPSVEHRRIDTALPRSGYLVLRLRTYPAWTVTLNDRPASPAATRDDGLYVFAVPAGPVHIAADWTTTPDALAGRCLSLVALLLLTTLCVIERQICRSGLSL